MTLNFLKAVFLCHPNQCLLKKTETNLDISSKEEFNRKDWLNNVGRAGRAKGKKGWYP